MLGITRYFSLGLRLAAICTVIAVLLAFVDVVVLRRPWREGLAILWAGAALVAGLATTAPDHWLRERGDYKPVPGSDTLARIDVLWTAPDTLAWWLLLGNVILYVPIGLLGALAWGIRRALVLGLAVSLTCELLQPFVFGRVATTDDVILNLTGTAVGAGAGYLLMRVWPALSQRPRRPQPTVA